MKKLMIAAFAVAFAAVAQAATVTWSQMGCGAYGDADNEFEGSMYLMLGGTDVASAFVETVIGAGADYETAYSTAIANAIGAGENWGDAIDITANVTLGTTESMFVVALDANSKGLYVSDIYSQGILAVGDTDIAFYGEGSYDSPFAEGVKEYTAGGWYTASTGSSVPEPTSALMLLVGLAGLALKRKVA